MTDTLKKKKRVYWMRCHKREAFIILFSPVNLSELNFFSLFDHLINKYTGTVKPELAA